jgi:predicted secreted acid phosphatase
MKKNVVIVDIDGTVAKVGERLKYLKQTPPDWDSFYNDCFDDEPIQDVVNMVEMLRGAGMSIYFCTGRRDSVREKTGAWLQKYFRFFIAEHDRHRYLLMRANGDYRHDVEVKPELLEKAGITLGSIAFILEDRNSMVTKWRELGLTCLQVADGDF